MTDEVFLIARYQIWIYGLLGLAALLYLNRLRQARHILGHTPFGLEKEAALRKQNTALAMLGVLTAIGFGVSFVRSYVAPTLAARPTTDPNSQPTPRPSPTPISESAGPLVVDTSGCSNPTATLTDPQSGTRISGSYEVRGTANIDNFAFYKFEISGGATNGVWVPLYGGSPPAVRGAGGAGGAGGRPGHGGDAGAVGRLRSRGDREAHRPVFGIKWSYGSSHRSPRAQRRPPESHRARSWLQHRVRLADGPARRVRPEHHHLPTGAPAAPHARLLFARLAAPHC